MADSSKNKPSLHTDLIIIDTLSLIITFTVSYVIKFGDLGFITSETWLPLLFIILLLNAVTEFISSPYGNFFKRPYYEEIITSLLISLYNLFASAVILYVLKIGSEFSRQTILTMYASYFVVSSLLKCIWKKLILSGKISLYLPEKQNLFIICDGDNKEEIIHNALTGDFELYTVKAAGIIGETNRTNTYSIPEITDKNGFIKYIYENSIDELLIATDKYNLSKDDFDTLIKNGTGIHYGVDFIINGKTEDYEIADVGIIKTLSIGNFDFTPEQTAYLFIKRIADITAGIIGLLFLLPVTVCVKIAYLCSKDTAKIFYKQTRIGKNEKKISIYKFRTMTPDAEKLLPELLKNEEYKNEWELNQKLKNDPRITKAGAFLRKSSLDELPQIINVLKGDMSIVGPRPLVEGELEQHNGLKLYNKIAPGITGWWGCNGRSNIDYKERLELEYYYIKNVSVYLDFLCILRTVLSVLKKDGAE